MSIKKQKPDKVELFFGLLLLGVIAIGAWFFLVPLI